MLVMPTLGQDPADSRFAFDMIGSDLVGRAIRFCTRLMEALEGDNYCGPAVDVGHEESP